MIKNAELTIVEEEVFLSDMVQVPKSIEITSEQTNVISLERATQIFEQQIEYRQSYWEPEWQREGMRDSGRLTIGKIEIGLTRVAEQNNLDTAYLVPSWIFFRCEEIHQNGDLVGCDNKKAVLAINAIGGSVIDRWVGY